MAKVPPLPERGQPLDVAYIYSIVSAINDINDQVSTATYNYTTIDTVSAGKQNIKTSETRMIGGLVTVSSDSTVTAASTKPFTYNFPSDFKYTPVVTATAINSGQTTAGENVSVILTDINRSSVTGLVRYNVAGNVSTIVNLIVIGIPN
jgi:hypothetical protein